MLFRGGVGTERAAGGTRARMVGLMAAKQEVLKSMAVAPRAFGAVAGSLLAGQL